MLAKLTNIIKKLGLIIIGLFIAVNVFLLATSFIFHAPVHKYQGQRALHNMILPDNFKVTEKKFSSGNALGIDRGDSLTVYGVFNDKITTSVAYNRVKKALTASGYKDFDNFLENAHKDGFSILPMPHVTVTIWPDPLYHPDSEVQYIKYFFY